MTHAPKSAIDPLDVGCVTADLARLIDQIEQGAPYCRLHQLAVVATTSLGLLYASLPDWISEDDKSRNPFFGELFALISTTPGDR